MFLSLGHGTPLAYKKRTVYFEFSLVYAATFRNVFRHKCVFAEGKSKSGDCGEFCIWRARLLAWCGSGGSFVLVMFAVSVTGGAPFAIYGARVVLLASFMCGAVRRR